jgi:hypothetical protein
MSETERDYGSFHLFIDCSLPNPVETLLQVRSLTKDKYLSLVVQQVALMKCVMVQELKDW